MFPAPVPDKPARRPAVRSATESAPQEDAHSLFARYSRLRRQSAWNLLRANDAPAILAMLRSHLSEGVLTSRAALEDAIQRDIEAFNAQSPEAFSRTAQAYLGEWVEHGYLERHARADSDEEEYSPSAGALLAFQILDRMDQSRPSVNESRLESLTASIKSLALDTDPDQERRIASLEAQCAQIQVEDYFARHTRAIRVLGT